jgi:branched-chain amino acid transport system permease protein
MGSVGGAMIAAVIVSTSSAVVASTVSPSWSEMTFFVILILVLLFRPQGLFGTVGRGAI